MHTGFIEVLFFLVYCAFHFYEPTNEHFTNGKIAVDAFAIISKIFFFQEIVKKESACSSSPYIYANDSSASSHMFWLHTF